MADQTGIFVVSLDFELFWGWRDIRTLDEFKANLIGTRDVMPRLLALFDEYGVRATWATVGLLFFETRDELLAGLPSRRPHYVNADRSPYGHMDGLGEDEAADPFHFGASLVKMIAGADGQEIGSHTFSHYCCLEDGEDVESFRADLQAAVAAAALRGITLKSLVFPRNRFGSEHLAACKSAGITAYRGNPRLRIYRAKSQSEAQAPWRRAARLADSYINISGHNCHRLEEVADDIPFNVPASRYVRPYSRSRKALESLRLRRIQADMAHAAENRLMYHLWWHPEDFGRHVEDNLAFLRHVLEHFVTMRERHGMESLSMGDVADRLVAPRVE